MSNKKSYKGSDVVLTIHGDEDVEVTAFSFKMHNYEKAEVSGESYYVEKACKQGAKKKAAKKHALNIENRITILEKEISLLERNPERSDNKEESEFIFRIGGSEDGDSDFVYIGKKDDDKPKKRKYRKSL